MSLKLEEMNWMEFGEIVPKKINTVLLPVGTIEAHGVASLGTDVSIPQFLCEKLAGDLNAVVAPPVYYGITRSLLSYPGSLTVSSATFESYVTEIMLSLAVIHWWILCEGLTREFFGEAGGHAGLDENAAMLAINPHLVKKARYKKDMVFAIKEGMYCMPAPGTILIYKEDQGYPQFDQKKAELYMKKVVKKIKDELLSAFGGWEGLKS
jgi:creatinine amidohydrolase